MKLKVLFLAALILAAGHTLPAVTLAPAFSDNMVLQRNKPIRVWGRAMPGEEIKVTLGNSSATTIGNGFGEWMLELPPSEAVSTPLQLKVEGQNTVTLNNLLIGEVWIISGQSNAEMILSKTEGGPETAATMNDPLIRVIGINRVPKDEPQTDLISRWGQPTPDTVGNFSAVGIYFALQMRKQLGIPVGVVDMSWGGTAIDVWLPDFAYFDSVDMYRHYQSRGEVDPNSPYAKIPTTLYNGMVNPLVPMTLGGIVWYQGEANLPEGSYYKNYLSALFKSWRKAFRDPDLPFIVVQIAPYNYALEHDHLIGRFWEAQATTTAAAGNAWIVATNDIGDHGDIHPRKKRQVGERAANLVLNEVLKIENDNYRFPVADSLESAGNELKLHFANAGELKSAGGSFSGWEIAGDDGAFFPANVRAAGNELTLSAPQVPAPRMVRYDWRRLATGDTGNEKGLPVAPFRMGQEFGSTALLNRLVPESAGFELVYEIDMFDFNLSPDWLDGFYQVDRSAEFQQTKIEKIGYFVKLVKNDGTVQYLFATMDPFTGDVGKIALPTKNSGAFFHQRVNNLEVFSNVAGVKNGKFPYGNIEFYPGDYIPTNSNVVPGADNAVYDFDDASDPRAKAGFGSMQLHNSLERQTLFSYNHWRLHQSGVTIACDAGIGNAPSGTPDWTGSYNWRDYQSAIMQILVKVRR